MWVFVCPGEEREGNACGCLSVPERSARVMHGVSVCPGEQCEGNAVCLSRRGVRG